MLSPACASFDQFRDFATAASVSSAWCARCRGVPAEERPMAKKLAFDKVLFTTVVLLVGLRPGDGLFGERRRWRAATAAPTCNPFLVKQALAAALGFVADGVVMHVDYRRLRAAGGGLRAARSASLALLVAVLFAPRAQRHAPLVLRRRRLGPARRSSPSSRWSRSSPTRSSEAGAGQPAASCWCRRRCVTGLLAGLILLAARHRHRGAARRDRRS